MGPEKNRQEEKFPDYFFSLFTDVLMRVPGKTYQWISLQAFFLDLWLDILSLYWIGFLDCANKSHFYREQEETKASLRPGVT